MYLVILAIEGCSSLFVDWENWTGCFCEDPATADKKMDLPDTFCFKI